MRHAKTLLTGASLGALLVGSLFYAAERGVLPALPALPLLVDTAEASTPPASEPASQPAPAGPPVGVAAAEARAITRWDEFTGRFEAVDEVAIRARVSGYLDAVHFRPGQVVEKGDLLFTIDPRPFEATVAEAGARLEQAEAARRLADAELERARQLLDRGHVSQSVYDTRQREAENAVAAIAAARAALDRARLDLGFTRIHAPVTGRISDDAVSPGNLISGGAGSGALTTIVSLDPIHFVFDATEQQYLEYMRATTSGGLRQRAAKTPVAVRLVDEADFTHPGVIDFVDNRIDRATGTIRGRAVLDNAKGMLTPGMFGRLRLATEENAETVLVPERAIGSDQTRKFVWVVRADDTVERRLVRIGERAGGLTVIEAGLEAGERVIVSGLHRVAEGAAVTPVPEREPERTVAVATR